MNMTKEPSKLTRDQFADVPFMKAQCLSVVAIRTLVGKKDLVSKTAGRHTVRFMHLWFARSFLS
jgi:hypothetical protein